MAKNKNRRESGGQRPQERHTVAVPNEDQAETPSIQEPMHGPRGKRQKRFGHN
jgi:hypothetical protein